MKHVTLGILDVGRIGLGAMGMSATYTGAGRDEAESIRSIHRALDLGVTLIDTAEIYGPYTNEELVGRAIKNRRGQIVLATRYDPALRQRALDGARAHRPRRGARRAPHAAGRSRRRPRAASNAAQRGHGNPRDSTAPIAQSAGSRS
jgi:aryl-alcohol dehydrogenase-like predicted oxidoreductase